MKQENLRKNKEKGITLIALVITMIILLILSGVTISMLLGENGIIRTAQEAKNTWERAIANEQEEIQNLVNELNNVMNEEGGTGGEEPGTDPNPEPEEPVDITTVTDIVQKEEGEKAKDTYGNIVIIPKGFKVVTSEGTTVPEGIVIEDANGNQFVWIAVGTVHKDDNPENDVTVQLGRYIFDTKNGQPTPVQLAYEEGNDKNYTKEIPIDDATGYDFIELATYREGVISSGRNGLNATAKDLEGFVNSVKNNGGYYIARYEASYGSGNSMANWKPLSKESTGYDTSHMNKVLGTLWNLEIQINASKICQNMYKEDNSVGVESDLINSYAWDTAIVFIQEMGNSNYANKADGNGSIKNTGTTGDKVCNIFDMAKNLKEWTTEYSTVISGGETSMPSTARGGYYTFNNYYAASRSYAGANHVNMAIGFRVLLYIK